jgi:hypothetical protein
MFRGEKTLAVSFTPKEEKLLGSKKTPPSHNDGNSDLAGGGHRWGGILARITFT